MRRLYYMMRNCFCGLLAIAVIASGRVRRARRKALSGDVITSIYFHNPNKRLFTRCIQWLARHGYTFISAGDLIDILHLGKPIPKGAVWLSFDDGYKEWLSEVLPVVHERRVPVTLFIPSGIVEGAGRLPWVHREQNGSSANRDSVTVSELKQIAGYPEVTIGAHTVNHMVTANLPAEQARFEVGQSRRALEALAGSKVTCFAYPEGRFDGQERSFLDEYGYRLAAATINDFITRNTDPYLVPRFCVSDNIPFPEAICNMVGVWRPALDPLIRLLQRLRKIADAPWKPSASSASASHHSA
jgi:peptidoglycan/xylan/chitin deacetylase (PgdA/CDA1 family)